MLVLGLSGGFSRHDRDFVSDLPHWFFHDSAAVLLDDGRVVCAVEEERLSRTKQTNRFPGQAVQICLDTAGARLGDLDAIAYFVEEAYAGRCLLVRIIYAVLQLIDGVISLREVAIAADVVDLRRLADDVRELWERRIITMVACRPAK